MASASEQVLRPSADTQQSERRSWLAALNTSAAPAHCCCHSFGHNQCVVLSRQVEVQQAEKRDLLSLRDLSIVCGLIMRKQGPAFTEMQYTALLNSSHSFSSQIERTNVGGTQMHRHSHGVVNPRKRESDQRFGRKPASCT